MSNNTTVYALPGTMCDQRLWSQLDTAFTIKHLPIPSCQSIPDIVHDIVKLLPNEPVNLMGFSLGGYIASALCAMYPTRINTLCIMANSPSALPDVELKQRQQLLNIVEKYGYSGIPKSKIESMLHTKNKNNDLLHKIISDMDNSFGIEALIQQLKATSERPDLVSTLSVLATPVYFLHGEEDQLINSNALEELVNSRETIKKKIIPDAGHMLPLENPQALTIELNHWFHKKDK